MSGIEAEDLIVWVAVSDEPGVDELAAAVA